MVGEDEEEEEGEKMPCNTQRMVRFMNVERHGILRLSLLSFPFSPLP